MNELVCEISECTELEKMQTLSLKVKNLYETCLFIVMGKFFVKDATIRDLQYEVESLKRKS